MEKVTRKDVAILAGVSESSVSVALHGSKSVKIAEETQIRIRDAAKKLGYVPNNAARTMSGRKSHNIGVLSPWTATTWYYAIMLDGITSVAQRENYGVLICEPLIEGHEPTGCIRFFQEGRFDAIIYLPPTTVEMPGLSSLREAGIRTIICNGIDPYGDMDYVVTDYASGIAKAARYLYNRSFRNLLYIFPKPYEELSSSDLDRYTGFQSIKALPGVRLSTAVFNEDIHIKNIEKMAEDLLTENSYPLGIITSIFSNAYALQSAVIKLGLKLDSDVAIISGDSPVYAADTVIPHIRGIELPCYKVGQTAASRLIDVLEGRQLQSRGIKLSDDTVFGD